MRSTSSTANRSRGITGGPPEHLRKLDPERLSDAARWLRQLVDMKATAAYRQKRYTTRNTADAVANAERLLRISHARIESSIDIGERIRP